MKNLFLFAILLCHGCATYLVDTRFSEVLQPGTTSRSDFQTYIKGSKKHIGGNPVVHHRIEGGHSLECLTFDVYKIYGSSAFVDHSEWVLFNDGILQSYGDGLYPGWKPQQMTAEEANKQLAALNLESQMLSNQRQRERIDEEHMNQISQGFQDFARSLTPPPAPSQRNPSFSCRERKNWDGTIITDCN